MKFSRRNFLFTAGALSISAGASLTGIMRLMASKENSQPNIVWITAEDMCPDLGCYGTPQVNTPNIDRLAEEGTRFTNTFTSAPVCSASRSGFMTGMYQTSIGAHNHRSHRDDGYTLPKGVKLVTDYYRQAGYFTANVRKITQKVKGTGKTDFNFHVDLPFDGDDWNQRKKGQPFFAHVNFAAAHRGRAWVEARKMKILIDPSKVVLPSYYPDHPVVRDDWANYLDSINLLDIQVGAVLKRLEDEGLADNTIVFFFGDHGRCLVRGKQWLYDSGIHVPLIVRWQGKIKSGAVNDDLISAIDFAPTSLKLAGIEPPTNMEGQVFLGQKAEKRKYIIAARDRCDETVDRIRCVRTKEYKYIRNYYPERPYTQLNRYKETQYPPLGILKKLHAEDKLTPEQEIFMAPERPREELYNLTSDPYEVHNLAGSPGMQNTLNELRLILDRWIEKSGDQGAVPEKTIWLPKVVKPTLH